MLALLYISGDGIKNRGAFKLLIIFVATYIGVCMPKYYTDHQTKRYTLKPYKKEIDVVRKNYVPGTEYLFLVACIPNPGFLRTLQCACDKVKK